VPVVPHPRILVVEDEWIIADQIAGALEEAGYDVVGPIGRLREAMALLADTSINAAIIDINVHGDRSFDLAAELGRLAIPYALLSGYSRGDLPFSLSLAPLLQKPVDAAKLRSCVEGLLHRQI
jgi:DNA-binding response OmpR family regulator